MLREEKSEAREQLIQAGLRIFAQHGYSGATVRDICEQAGRNLASINYYFGSKEGFFTAVREYAMHLRQQRFNLCLQEMQDDPWLALRRHVTRLLENTFDEVLYNVNLLFMRELLDAEDLPEDTLRDTRIEEYEKKMKQLLVALLGEEAATKENMVLLIHTCYSLCLYLPISTFAQARMLKDKHDHFLFKPDFKQDKLTEFVMSVLKRTVEDMRDKAAQSGQREAKKR